MSLFRFYNLCILLGAMLLGACGFRIQGTGEFPETLATTYIDTNDRYTVFYRKLRTELEQGGVQVVESPVHSDAVIRIREDESGQTVLTVSARNVPTEYNVFYRVSYSVDANAEEVLPLQSLDLAQAYTYNANTVLGKNRERDAIQESLAENLVRQVSQQLSLL